MDTNSGDGPPDHVDPGSVDRSFSGGFKGESLADGGPTDSGFSGAENGGNTAAVHSYYIAIDDHDYDRLADVLSPSFVHYRPDRTIDGKPEFLEFMRETRPNTETTHEILTTFSGGDDVAVQGRLRGATGGELFAFVDVFTTGSDGTITTVRTYTQ